MGLGIFKNGRYQPISDYVESWAWQEEQRREGLPCPPLPKTPTQKVLALGTCNADGSGYQPYDNVIERTVAAGTLIVIDD